ELGVVPRGTTLPERPSWVDAWAPLPETHRRLFARQMEVFAGFVSHADHHIGRLIDFLAAIGRLDDTLFVVLSDNGTSAEGGPLGSFNEHRFTHDLVDDIGDTLARAGDPGGPRPSNHSPLLCPSAATPTT